MTAQNYILDRLKSLKLPAEPIKVGSSPEEVVYSRLMSKKFRKMKPGDPCVEITKRVVAKAVREQKPILVTECFGGNKLWRFGEAPEVDWAELFSLFYFVDWMKSVAAVHKPGMIFDYFSQDLAVEKLDNLTREEVDAYSSTFRSMIAFVEPYLPAGVSIQYRRHREMYEDESKYDRELQDAVNDMLAKSDGKLPVLDEKMRAATELNVRPNPGQTDDPEWREKVELEHQALFNTPTLGQYLQFEDMVWTCPTYYEDSIVTGSTKRSLAKFWAAVGVLQADGSGYNEIVLTPKQLDSAAFEWQDVSIDGLDSKNFSKIRIIDTIQ